MRKAYLFTVKYRSCDDDRLVEFEIAAFTPGEAIEESRMRIARQFPGQFYWKALGVSKRRLD